MKKVLTSLLILVLILSMLPVGAFAETYDGLRKNEKKTQDKDYVPTATEGIYMDWEEATSYYQPYVIKVDRVNQIVTILSESYTGDFDVIEKQFICSTGTKKDPTPKGEFTLSDASRRTWRYFKTYKTYVRYGVHIQGNYFFHSLLYKKQDLDTLSKTSYRKLGSPASHGCIRMLDEDIKWMFENCLAGTKVYVMDCKEDKELHDSLMPPPLD